ncbi:hypothetical protein DPMN_129845 [Dreissena polymorpha]|uniref:Uncharacterized protein n=1 Tax=Dreissena polymorpha TaxID=45954 RepID=A0A9D4JYM5_DREPO|nr:hypothetical protein DPMN_129845 [Dreissena polymorpha]
MEAAVSVYKALIKFSQVSSVTVSVQSKSRLVVRASLTQRDLERAEKVKFAKSFFVSLCSLRGGQCSVDLETPPEETNNEYIVYIYLFISLYILRLVFVFKIILLLVVRL